MFDIVCTCLCVLGGVSKCAGCVVCVCVFARARAWWCVCVLGGVCMYACAS